MDDYSKMALLRFLDTAVSKGDLNGNTGGGMKSAATKLLEQLAETDDVRNTDTQAAVRQYNNRHPGELSHDSLRVYESRLKKAVDAFTRSVAEPTKNPWGSKPASTSVRKAESKKKDESSANSAGNGLATQVGHQNISSGKTTVPQTSTVTSSLTIPYPLRSDFVAQVVVPMNMTPSEAKNLSNFILAIAPSAAA
jgi:hypothetical protein